MTASKCEQRGLGFFFGERDRQTRLSRFVCASLLFLSLWIFPWGVEFTDAHHHQSLSLPLESMSVIARCATFVATKTSLKQQFAVNNRSSATKIVRYAIQERKRWERLSIWSFRAFATKCFSLFFGSLNCTENGGKTTSYYCCSLFSLERLPLTTTTTFFIIVVIVTPIRRILTRRFPLLCARVNRE